MTASVRDTGGRVFYLLLFLKVRSSLKLHEFVRTPLPVHLADIWADSPCYK